MDICLAAGCYIFMIHLMHANKFYPRVSVQASLLRINLQAGLLWINYPVPRPAKVGLDTGPHIFIHRREDHLIDIFAKRFLAPVATGGLVTNAVAKLALWCRFLLSLCYFSQKINCSTAQTVMSYGPAAE